jgi:hypothetical protein
MYFYLFESHIRLTNARSGTVWGNILWGCGWRWSKLAGWTGSLFPTEIAHLCTGIYCTDAGYAYTSKLLTDVLSYQTWRLRRCAWRGLENSWGLQEEDNAGLFVKTNATCHSNNGFVLICTRMPSYCTAWPQVASSCTKMHPANKFLYSKCDFRC